MTDLDREDLMDADRLASLAEDNELDSISVLEQEPDDSDITVEDAHGNPETVPSETNYYRVTQGSGRYDLSVQTQGNLYTVQWAFDGDMDDFLDLYDDHGQYRYRDEVRTDRARVEIYHREPIEYFDDEMQARYEDRDELQACTVMELEEARDWLDGNRDKVSKLVVQEDKGDLRYLEYVRFIQRSHRKNDIAVEGVRRGMEPDRSQGFNEFATFRRFHDAAEPDDVDNWDGIRYVALKLLYNDQDYVPDKDDGDGMLDRLLG